MNKKAVAVEMIRELNRLSRSLRMNEVQVTATYARLAKESRLIFGGISATDALVLEAIGEQLNVNGQFVAEQISVTKGGASKILARLRGKGLIQGERDKSDYKSTIYTLTETGNKAYTFHKKMLSVASAEIYNLIAGYTDNDIARVREYIAGVAECLGNISENLKNVDVK